MKNKITIGILVYVLLSASNFFINPIEIYEYNPYLLQVFQFFSPISIDFLTFESQLRIPQSQNGSYTLVNLNSVLFAILFFVSALIYFLSNEKNSKLIRFSLLFFFISNFIQLIYMLILILTTMSENQHLFLSVLYLLKTILFLFLCYKALIYLNNLKELIPIETKIEAAVKISKTEENKERVSARDVLNKTAVKKFNNEIPFQLASKGDRFLNYTLDTFFAILLFSGIFFNLAKNENFREIMNSFGDETGNSFVFLLCFGFFRLIYYFISERLFKITPAKAITETQIYSINESTVSTTTILGRTLIRFIPFEPFSFFGKNGWHDQLSETTVLKNKQTGNLYIFTILLFLFFIIISILNGFNEYWLVN